MTSTSKPTTTSTSSRRRNWDSSQSSTNSRWQQRQKAQKRMQNQQLHYFQQTGEWLINASNQCESSATRMMADKKATTKKQTLLGQPERIKMSHKSRGNNKLLLLHNTLLPQPHNHYYQHQNHHNNNNHNQATSRPLSKMMTTTTTSLTGRSSVPLLLTAVVVLLLQTNSDNNHLRLLQFAEAQTSLLSLSYLPSSSSSSSYLLSGQSAPSILKRDLSSGSAYTTRFLSSAAAAEPPSVAKSSTVRSQQRTANVCQVSNGESVAIVEIEESRASDMSQNTNPFELPISGSVERGEIELKIESETHKYFHVEGKRLRLARPLDRDAVLKENSTQIQQQPIASIYLQISCTDKRPINSGETNTTANTGQARKVIIPVLVKVLDLNDNAPKFTSPVYTVQVNELTPIDSILVGTIQAVDLDSANNGLIEYSLVVPLPPQQTFVTTTNRPGIPHQAPRLVQRAQPELIGSATLASMDTMTTTPGYIGSTSTTTLASASAIPTTTMANDNLGQTITTTLSSAGGSAASAGAARSEPTINLNSEPIINGPMEESGEEESDEALLASMNSSQNNNANGTGNSTDLESTDSDSAVLMMPTITGRRRRRRGADLSTLLFKRRSSVTHLMQTTTTSLDNESSSTSSVPITTYYNTNKPKADLWTNLMAPSSDDLSIGAAGDNQPGSSRLHQHNQVEAISSSLPNTQAGGSGSSKYIADWDSLEYFSLELAPNTNRPVIKLKKALDYETKRVHVLTVMATDMATNKHDRLFSTATIVIKVLDGDDQGPAFVLDQTGCATASVPLTTASSLTVAGGSSTSGLSLITTNGDQLAAASDEPQTFPGRRGELNAPAADISDQLDVEESGGSYTAAATTTALMTKQQKSALQSSNLPKGFKVTDENFDFSDMSTGDDADEDQAILPHRSLSLPADLPPTGTSSVSGGGGQSAASSRSRRYPPPGQVSASGNLLPTTMSPTMISRSTKSSHYLTDYSCLSTSPLVLSGQAEYFSTVMSGDTDYLLRVAPQAIKARDRDELNAPIRYSFINGTPANYSHYFQINPLDASIKQVAPIERTASLAKFVIWVQAQEQTANKLSSFAKLTIDIVPTDKNPPVLVPNSYAGFIEENAPIGSRVMVISNGESGELSSLSLHNNTLSSPMQIIVIDEDYSPGSATVGGSHLLSLSHLFQQSNYASNQRNAQLYEFETTSDAFKVNKDGYVYVNRSPLDRDPPNQPVHMFQVTARQIGLASSRSISSPVSINVTLIDMNDNPPIISNSSLVPIKIQADSGRLVHPRIITTIRALDKDLPENARMYFSIHHVSNNGKERFRIREDTGELEALGKFVAGEQFSLTIQVADELARTSQGILEVLVVPGPNTGGPQFVVDTESGDNSRGYSVEINEGIAPHSAILQVQAKDPENDPIAYSIVDGNINNDFYINSKTGHIYVNNKLDREEVSAYSLLVHARDSGGLATNRPVFVSISDNNDENPVFLQEQYTFSIEEGVAGRLLGRVSARDGDAGENGQISYLLDQQQSSPLADGRGPLFSIDQHTGDIKVLEPLDYEQSKSHTLIVTAKDHGENPRSTTASVLVRVVDVQDESPYFERYYIEARLQENLGNHRVAQVQARDPDSVAQITYVLKSGDSNLFSVDPQTGIVSTTARGLDFEESRAYTLIVGTVEHQTDNVNGEKELADMVNLLAAGGSLAPNSDIILDRSPVCRIDITVQDINDNVPHFVSQPLPVRIQDSAQLGNEVTKLMAEDRDGSEPNNQIRYELIGAGSQHLNSETSSIDQFTQQQMTSDKCLQSFMIDATSGSISVKSDLKRDSQSECHLLIRARDLGQQPQSLSSTTTLTVFIDHIAEISPASMIGFADTSFTVELEENCAPNTLVKVLPIVNKPKMNFPMSCEIVSGNEFGKFYVIENEQRDCEIKTRDHTIDYELRQRYMLTLRLNTIGTGSSKTLAQVNINILDKNDNRPVFHQSARYSHLTQNRFLAAIANDAPSESQVLQLRASDPDSSNSNGLVSYEILNDNELEGRFRVDPIDGIVRTSRPVEDIPSTRLPIRLKVMARDNPEVPSNSLDSIAEIVVNLIEDRHRVALVLKDAPTGRVLDNKEELLSAIQERTGLISGLEKADSLKIQRNGTLESDVSGTDFWFYLIEPGTFRIVPSDDSRVRAALFEQRSHNSLLDIVGQTLGFTKARLRLPYSMSGPSSRSSSVSFSRSLVSAGGLASVLILIALFIAIISAIVVVYQCGSWSSYSRVAKEKAGGLYLNQPPPPPAPHPYYGQCGGFACGPKGPRSLTATSQDNYAFRSPFSTLIPPPNSHHHHHNEQHQPSLMPQLVSQNSRMIGKQQQSQNGTLEPIYDPSMAAALGKEYETQMLKMSVLFDDSNSLDEQNLNEHNISKKLN